MMELFFDLYGGSETIQTHNIFQSELSGEKDVFNLLPLFKKKKSA
jgi:hypothetical protein